MKEYFEMSYQQKFTTFYVDVFHPFQQHDLNKGTCQNLSRKQPPIKVTINHHTTYPFTFTAHLHNVQFHGQNRKNFLAMYTYQKGKKSRI